jgi:hypothetical protein
MANEEMRDQTQYGDAEKRGYMGDPHRTGAHQPEDGTALPENEPALEGMEPENANVNDTDAGDARLVDPGTSRRTS